MNIIQAIGNTAICQDVEEDILQDLVKLCHAKNFKKGQEIFTMGDKAHGFFIILEGWVKLYRISRTGEEIIINVFGPGESFAEAAVFKNDPAYPVSAEALEQTKLIEVPRSFFVQKIEEDSSFALRILGSIASHQHYLVQQIEQVTTRTAPQRIGAFILRFCKEEKTNASETVVHLPYDKAVISARLNIKPETFSRALAKLEPYGVTANGRDIYIKDKEELASFCDCQ